MAAPSVAVTWLDAPTWVGAGGALEATGSIPVGESRWYRVIAMDGSAVSSWRRHSPPSVEIGPFTADAVNRRVRLTWNAVAGATFYRVYVRTSTNPNPTYSCLVPNSVGANFVFGVGNVTTFLDSAAAFTSQRAYFESGICYAKMIGGEIADPGTYRTIYDAIVAAAPSYARRIIPAEWCVDVTGPYFALAAFIEIGDGATPTYFHDRDSCVFIIGGFRYFSLGQGVTMHFGEYDAATGRRSRGSGVYLGGYGQSPRPATAAAGRIFIGGVDGSEINDSYFEDIGFRGMTVVPPTTNGTLVVGTDCGAQIGNDAAGIVPDIRGSEIAGFSSNLNASGQHSLAEVRDLYMRGCWGGWPHSIDLEHRFDNVVIEDSAVGLIVRQSGLSLMTWRYVGLRVLGRTTCDLYFRTNTTFGPYRVVLRDAEFGDVADNEDPVLQQVAAQIGSTLEYESLVAIRLIRSDGTPISAAPVSILDVNGATLASGVTDASGVVPSGLAVSYLVYATLTTGALAAASMSAHVAAAAWSKSDKRPLTLVIGSPEPLLEPLRIPFSPTGSVSYLVVMRPDNTCRVVSVVEPQEIASSVGAIEIPCVVANLDVDAAVASEIPVVGEFD